MQSCVSTPSIVLTAHEEEIVSVLLEAAQPAAAAESESSPSQRQSQSQVVVRIAGGWVRDKLLGYESDDIDVALENCTGIEFANRVNATLNRLGYEKHNIGLIQANPDQSKHLETANVRILGTFVDCVNLRSEVYADNSRIPDIRFGTAEEDAMRRDFTINSMFYNIHTKQIEDFSVKGVEDLTCGIIRTPLPPLVTFKDDPLRVLRAIRFASRYDFSFDEDLVVAASSPMISKALVEKISRERILVELDGMLAGSRCRPPAALWSIFALDLFDTVFNPSHIDSITIDSYWTVISSLSVIVVNALMRLVYFDNDCISNKEFMTFRSEGCGCPISSTSSDITAAEAIIATTATNNQHNVFEGMDELGSSSLSGVEFPSCILYSHLSSLIASSSQSSLLEERETLYEDLLMTQRLIYIATSVSGLQGVKCREINLKDQQQHQKTSNDEEKAGGKKKQPNPQQSSKEAKMILLSTHTLRQLKLDTKSIKSVEIVMTGANFVKNFVRRNSDALIYSNFDLRRCGNSGESVDVDKGRGRVDDSEMREELGMFVREVKQVWQCAVIYACAMDIVESFDRSLFKSFESQSLQPPRVKLVPVNLNHAPYCSAKIIEGSEQLEILISMNLVMKYVMVERLVHIYELEEAWTIRPLFDSKSIGKELGIKQGPQIGVVIEQAIRWQLRNPRGSGEDLMSFLKEGDEDELC